ncbi:hypothetical protein DPMN_139977 [Dreissena polymorpha]|uniref:Uncharacterized protein n=1 Tax=Dreissena polymorpha TaxID=45954 RepID=A0A9D4JLB1_DREPO|nr:hypothetical protein DPMN_139977 [Dreissena polymorpha]
MVDGGFGTSFPGDDCHHNQPNGLFELRRALGWDSLRGWDCNRLLGRMWTLPWKG